MSEGEFETSREEMGEQREDSSEALAEDIGGEPGDCNAEEDRGDIR